MPAGQLSVRTTSGQLLQLLLALPSRSTVPFVLVFTFFTLFSLSEAKYSLITTCLIGADLPGAVDANVSIGKGSMDACTQRKKLMYLLFIGVSSCVGYSCEAQTFASEY